MGPHHADVMRAAPGAPVPLTRCVSALRGAPWGPSFMARDLGTGKALADMTDLASSAHQDGPGKIQAVPAGPPTAPPAPRHEVAPTVPYAVVPGPLRDTF